MDIHAPHLSDPQLVADFCESEFALQSRGFLIPYAAQVVYIAKMCRSSRLTAKFLSKALKRDFSRRPVDDLLAKVKSGEIVVTPEQLARAAAQHPKSTHFAELCPDILNTTNHIEMEDVTEPMKKITTSKREMKDKRTNTGTTNKKTREVAAPKSSALSATGANPKDHCSEKSNELLDKVDAELRQAGIPYD